MAAAKLCSIDWCDKPVFRQGWCRAHWKRWRRHGDPTAGRVPNGTLRIFLELAKSFDEDACLIWPYSRDQKGYAQIEIAKKCRFVHRIVCEAIHGIPPTPKHHAAHSCGNGKHGCVSPRHLRWATPRENESDKIAHGTVKSKLKVEDVLRIKGMLQSHTAVHIAKMFGVSPATIDHIKSGRNWSRLNAETLETGGTGGGIL